jgi:tRNA-(ms[2]io[6]A)-hydroxylase
MSQRAETREKTDWKTEKDRAWLACALSDTKALLRDHAHCEKKAAGTAIALIAGYPDHPGLVQSMAELAQEEMGHFEEVHRALQKRGWTLGPDLGDPYVKALIVSMKQTSMENHETEPRHRLRDRLLVSALIEARSCERLQLLGEAHPDPDLAEMFTRFATAEASHGRLFYDLAKDLDPSRTPDRFAELKRLERALLQETEIRCAMH